MNRTVVRDDRKFHNSSSMIVLTCAFCLSIQLYYLEDLHYSNGFNARGARERPCGCSSSMGVEILEYPAIGEPCWCCQETLLIAPKYRDRHALLLSSYINMVVDRLYSRKMVCHFGSNRWLSKPALSLVTDIDQRHDGEVVA